MLGVDFSYSFHISGGYRIFIDQLLLFFSNSNQNCIVIIRTKKQVIGCINNTWPDKKVKFSQFSVSSAIKFGSFESQLLISNLKPLFSDFQESASDHSIFVLRQLLITPYRLSLIRYCFILRILIWEKCPKSCFHAT